MKLLGEHFWLTTGTIAAADLKQKLNEVDIFWFRLAYNINRENLLPSSRCRYLVTPVTGIDHIDEHWCEQLGVKIICLRGEKEFLKEVRATAEHTILLMQMLMRNASAAVEDVKHEFWRRDLFRGFELYKKKIGIVGYGRLGKIVAEYGVAFGCQVGFFDVEAKQSPNYIQSFENLEALLSWSDIVSIHIPYNQTTHHLFNQEVLSHLDANKWLINTSRGGVIDDSALLNSLEKGQIAGAALDVLFGEPDIKHNPLVAYAKKNRNLVLTPHIGGCTFESFEKTEYFVANKLLKQIGIN